MTDKSVDSWGWDEKGRHAWVEAHRKDYPVIVDLPAKSGISPPQLDKKVTFDFCFMPFPISLRGVWMFKTQDDAKAFNELRKGK